MHLSCFLLLMISHAGCHQLIMVFIFQFQDDLLQFDNDVIYLMKSNRVVVRCMPVPLKCMYYKKGCDQKLINFIEKIINLA